MGGALSSVFVIFFRNADTFHGAVRVADVWGKRTNHEILPGFWYCATDAERKVMTRENTMENKQRRWAFIVCAPYKGGAGNELQELRRIMEGHAMHFRILEPKQIQSALTEHPTALVIANAAYVAGIYGGGRDTVLARFIAATSRASRGRAVLLMHREVPRPGVPFMETLAGTKGWIEGEASVRMFAKIAQMACLPLTPSGKDPRIFCRVWAALMHYNAYAQAHMDRQINSRDPNLILAIQRREEGYI